MPGARAGLAEVWCPLPSPIPLLSPYFMICLWRQGPKEVTKVDEHEIEPVGLVSS
jgi:hypothetical protein